MMIRRSLVTLTTRTLPDQSIVPRQSFIGVVIGTKMQKTVKVRVEHNTIHPIVLKNIISHKNFLVHDSDESCVIGDIVRIVSANKISKRKNFVVGEIVKPANRFIDDAGIIHTQTVDVRKDTSLETEMKKYGKQMVG